MRGSSALTSAFLFLGLAAACSESESSPTPPPVIAAAGSAGTGQCDNACTCANGLYGSFDCAKDACSCDACPAFAPPAPVSFQACGGDPTGFWRLSDYEQGGFELALTKLGSGGLTAICTGQVPQPAQPEEALLEVKADGSAALYFQMPSFEFELAQSCLADAGATCSALPSYGCEELDCGLCRCNAAAQSVDEEKLTWKQAATTLTLTDEKGNPASPWLDFCVAGDTLSYRVSGASNLLTFERVYRAGEPQPCPERSPADCESGGTCVLGRCVGTGSCSEAAGEAECAKFQDCAWDPAACYGQAYAHCTVSDYANGTPGCVLSEVPTECGGTPSVCAEQPGCAAKGCSIGPTCEGGERSCVYGDEGIPGCVCDNINCTGKFSCSDVPGGENECESAGSNDCEWNTTACVGTAIPCKELSANECEMTIGCVLQAP
jgi:hypothetical protein